MNHSPDMAVFSSRLHYHGSLVFDTAHRIGATRSTAVDVPDLPILRTQEGLPYIPGSSFKGAWRSYTEAMLRTIQEQPGIQDKNLSCLSISKPSKRSTPDPDNGRCLTQEEVTQIKRHWQQPGQNRPYTSLDEELRQRSCWVCRVFGSSWLAAKVLVKDLQIDETSFWHTETRDGVGIDRDTGRAATGFKYQFEAVPSGAQFHLEILVENASLAELGLVMLGLNAFTRGEILLGGAKSRGLGWCHLQPDWIKSYYVAPDNLLAYLLSTSQTTPANSQLTAEWLNHFADVIQSQIASPSYQEG